MDFKKLSLLLLPLFGYFYTANAQQNSGQNFTISPYSNFGLGEVLGNNFVHAGYSSQTHSGAYTYSLYNPATLGSLKFATFDFGLNARSGSVQTGDQSQSFRGGALHYLSLAYKTYHHEFVRIKKDSAAGKDSIHRKRKVTNFAWNGSLSLYPTTSVGYNYKLETLSPIKTRTAHSGKGGVNTLQWNNGFKVGNHINLGYSVGFMFGQLVDNSVFSLPDSTDYNFVEDVKTVDIRGWQHRLGVLYNFTIDSTYHKIGLSYGFNSGMHATQTRLTRTLEYSSTGFLYAIDTIILNVSAKQKFTMPSSFGAGYTFQYRRRWSIGLDYKNTLWGNYSAFFSPGNKLATRNDYGITFMLNPVDEKMPRQKHHPIPIRLGARYSETQNVFTIGGNSTTIIEQSAFFGFGIPFTRRYYDSRVLRSLVNIQIDYITRGQLSTGLAREQYIGATVGFNLGDIWFVRRKFGD